MDAVPDADPDGMTARLVAAADMLRNRRTEIAGLEELACVWRADARYRELAVPLLRLFLDDDHPEPAMATARRLRDEARRLPGEPAGHARASERDRSSPP
ncbi:hypothetical protein G3I59_14155 [Amycolatopsis rubida]|uniref:Uncharacterized protein n=1 Tax=Amycolatopsis rubida TaxID=112413 RepID=A0ABX0BRG9_9PSEU|nr:MULTISPECIES: hypothetical protein [Amycolatopsis]MYW91713.1 hypothetical protein [Amycolatopsis rubida]NEC56697.1 hypothetical protein [Amycolatopsis rubida]OAP20408.1 hypothetical protein A4R44_08832 [Amycolatopsis sp. M39]